MYKTPLQNLISPRLMFTEQKQTHLVEICAERIHIVIDGRKMVCLAIFGTRVCDACPCGIDMQPKERVIFRCP
jgi:hypothetical protein